MHLIETQLQHKVVHPNKQRNKKIFDLCMPMSRPQIPGGANGLQIQSQQCLLQRGRLSRRRPVSSAGRNRRPGRWPPNTAVPPPPMRGVAPRSAWRTTVVRGSSRRRRRHLAGVETATPNRLPCPRRWQARSMEPRATTHARAGEQARRAAMAPG
jgi:hypothetical protein